MQQVLKPLHRRHAQRLNRARAQQGHVWQGRCFSSVLDSDCFRAALRHVERNPVRARIAPKAGSYPWSSARGHCGLAKDARLAARPSWRGDLSDIASWSQWLSEPDGEEALLALRRNAMMGLPCGGGKFIRRMERLAGRPLRVRPQGRPGRSGSDGQP